MNVVVAATIIMALAFALTTGFHDAGSAVGALVATHAARPRPALVVVALATVVGPLVTGGAVAATVAELVTVSGPPLVPLLGAAMTGAVAWNIITWRLAIPSSASHALVGGLVGAGLVAAGSSAVYWGGFDGARPVGVIGVLVVLVVAPFLGGAVGWAASKVAHAVLRRASRRVERPIRAGEWIGSALLGGAVSANDTAKAVGVMGAALVAAGHGSSLSDNWWITPVAALALAVGVASGGWGLARTIGRRIVRLRSIDGLVSTGGSFTVLLVSTLTGAPVSTTQVVTSSIVGTGVSRDRFHHVQWRVVRSIVTTWLTTLPAAGIMAAMSYPIWSWLA